MTPEEKRAMLTQGMRRLACAVIGRAITDYKHGRLARSWFDSETFNTWLTFTNIAPDRFKFMLDNNSIDISYVYRREDGSINYD